MFDVFDDQWVLWDMIRELEALINEESYPIDEWNYDKKIYQEDCTYETVCTGKQKTGELWDGEFTYFFSVPFDIPSHLTDKTLKLYADIQGEGLLYVDRVTVGSFDYAHTKVVLPKPKNDSISLLIIATKHVHDAAKHYRQYNRSYPELIFRETSVIVENEDIRNYYYHAKVLFDICVQYGKRLGDPLFEVLKTHLMRLTFHEPSKLRNEIKNQLAQLIDEVKTLDLNLNLSQYILNGHSHLDLAFKWRTMDSIRKIERTNANAIGVMKRNEKVIYTQSQMQLLSWTKDKYEKQYHEFKELIHKGRIEVIGGLWVEPDTNIPSGESLVRQILYGQKFMLEEFGFHSTVCYLPDTFGYVGILPQLLKKSGYDYFVTNKLDWNDTNKFPYNYFIWEGIDGTGVKSYLNPKGYSGPVSFKEFYEQHKNARQETLSNVHIFQYGEGDGGGGISDEMTYYLNALESFDDLIKMEYGTVEEGLNRIDQTITNYPKAHNELYLEKHRGVLTSQALIKKYNRTLENKIQFIESLCVLLGEDRQKVIERNWKKILYNQFHDIISGTITSEAVDDTHKLYQEVEYELDVETDQLISRHFIEHGRGFSVINSNPVDQLETIYIRCDVRPEFSDEKIVDHLFGDFYQVTCFVSAYSVITIDFLNDVTYAFSSIEELISACVTIEETKILENRKFYLQFDELGDLVSFVDKEQNHEFLEGKGNIIEAYVNRGGYFDSWDLKKDYDRIKVKYADSKVIKICDTDVLKIMQVRRVIKNSTFIQYIILNERQKFVEMIFDVDAQDKSMYYKLSFNTSLASDEATYDLSFGNIKRSTKNETEIEKAQFEYAMQKWMDLSDGRHGFTIINDCKYGGVIKNKKMSLSLIKTAIFPDPTQDIGRHRFKLALFPHEDKSHLVEVNDLALSFNKPCLLLDRRLLTNPIMDPMRFFERNDSIKIDSIKRSENSRFIVFRLVDTSGYLEKINLNVSMYEGDLLENITSEKVSSLQFSPFEVKTLLMEL